MAFGVVFDVDGTLVTSGLDLRAAKKALLAEFGRFGFDPGALDPGTPTQGIMEAAAAQSAAGKGRGYGEFRDSAFSLLDSFEVRGAGTTALLPGAKEAVERLRSNGARLGILTNSGRKGAAESLRLAGISSSFEFVLTRDETEVMKPRPEGIAMAASRIGLPKSSVYYVGDSLYDIQAAKAAGVLMVSVATGSYAEGRLKSAGADWVIPNLTGLCAVLGL